MVGGIDPLAHLVHSGCVCLQRDRDRDGAAAEETQGWAARGFPCCSYQSAATAHSLCFPRRDKWPGILPWLIYHGSQPVGAGAQSHPFQWKSCSLPSLQCRPFITELERCPLYTQTAVPRRPQPEKPSGSHCPLQEAEAEPRGHRSGAARPG